MLQVLVKPDRISISGSVIESWGIVRFCRRDVYSDFSHGSKLEASPFLVSMQFVIVNVKEIISSKKH